MLIKKNILNKKQLDKKFFLTITKEALNYIKKIMDRNNKIIGFKIGVKYSGCAGYKYIIKEMYCHNIHDILYEYYGIKIYVSVEDLIFTNGMELDYVKDNLNQVFKFKNSNIKHTCGCGSSFSLNEN